MPDPGISTENESDFSSRMRNESFLGSQNSNERYQVYSQECYLRLLTSVRNNSNQINIYGATACNSQQFLIKNAQLDKHSYFFDILRS